MNPEEVIYDATASEPRQIGNFTVSVELIALALCLPEDHKIIGIEWDPASRCPRIYLEGPEMPVCQPGLMSDTIFPLVHQSINEAGRIVYRFEWRQKINE